jgi:hypothetical protein
LIRVFLLLRLLPVCGHLKTAGFVPNYRLHKLISAQNLIPLSQALTATLRPGGMKVKAGPRCSRGCHNFVIWHAAHCSAKVFPNEWNFF